MQSMVVVQTFNRTSLSNRATNRVWDVGNPANAKYHVPAPLKIPSVTRKKIIVLCYFNNGVGSSHIPWKIFRTFFFLKKIDADNS